MVKSVENVLSYLLIHVNAFVCLFFYDLVYTYIWQLTLLKGHFLNLQTLRIEQKKLKYTCLGYTRFDAS